MIPISLKRGCPEAYKFDAIDFFSLTAMCASLTCNDWVKTKSKQYGNEMLKHFFQIIMLIDLWVSK